MKADNILFNNLGSMLAFNYKELNKLINKYKGVVLTPYEIWHFEIWDYETLSAFYYERDMFMRSPTLTDIREISFRIANVYSFYSLINKTYINPDEVCEDFINNYSNR